MRHKPFIYGLLLLINLLFAFITRAQVQQYKQFAGELDFNTDLSSKWSLEGNVGQTFSTVPGGGATLAQIMVREWVHYAFSDKWKFSFFYAYYFNKYVPEIDQREAPEWRSAMEAIYYIHRKRSVISTRWRIEDRHILNPDTVYEAVDRLRGQVKITYPFNGKIISPNVVYGIGSEEIFLKTRSKISGADIFDRNRITIGLGYCTWNNIQLELTYVDEFLPRKPASENFSVFQVNLVFNNIFKNLEHQLFGGSQKTGGSAD